MKFYLVIITLIICSNSIISQTYQPLENQRLSTSNSVSFAGLNISSDLSSSGGMGRFGGFYQASAYTGPAAEIGQSGNGAYYLGFNRSAGTYIPVFIGGLGVTINGQGSGTSITGGALTTGNLNSTSGNFSGGLAVTGNVTVTGSTTSTGTITAVNVLEAQGLFYHRSSLNVLNKAVNGWVTWGSRNTTGLETVLDLANIGTIAASGNITAPSANLTNTLYIGNVTSSQAGSNVLAVNGSAIFTKATVKVYPWADYVFDDDYKILKLPDLEKFIKLNHRLPEMPSANEVEKDGIDIGSNQALLLKKIEELTLLLIEQDKELTKQRNLFTLQQLQIAELIKSTEDLKTKINK